MIEKLAESVNPQERMVAGGISGRFELKMGRLLGQYDLVGKERGVRPAYERPVSPETARKIEELDARAKVATLKFKAVLGAYEAERTPPEPVAEESVEPVMKTRPSDTAAIEEKPVPVVETPAEPEKPVFDLKWNIREDDEFREIQRQIELRRPDKIDHQVRLEAMREFQRKNPDKFKAYTELEKTTVYRDLHGSPVLRNDYTFNQMFLSRDLGGLGYSQTDPHELHRAYETIARYYPEKAKAYAQTDPKMKHLIEYWADRK